MTDRIKHLHGMIEVPKEGILSIDIADTEAESVSVFGMAQGTHMHAHTAPVEATVLTLSGTAQWELSGETFEVKEGDWFLMPANEPHAIKATSPYVFLLSKHK